MSAMLHTVSHAFCNVPMVTDKNHWNIAKQTPVVIFGAVCVGPFLRRNSDVFFLFFFFRCVHPRALNPSKSVPGGASPCDRNGWQSRTRAFRFGRFPPPPPVVSAFIP